MNRMNRTVMIIGVWAGLILSGLAEQKVIAINTDQLSLVFRAAESGERCFRSISGSA